MSVSVHKLFIDGSEIVLISLGEPWENSQDSDLKILKVLHYQT